MPMSDFETPPPPDSDREVTDNLDAPDPEAPSDSPVVHPPQQDADRPVTIPEDTDGDLQEENAATSLDQPSDQTS